MTPLVTLSRLSWLIGFFPTLNDVVSHLENGFLIFQVLENVRVHLDANFETFIEDGRQSVVKDAGSVLAHWEFAVELSVLVKD